VVAPSTPGDAKGLLAAAVRDDNPVVFFESKPLYRSLRGHVPEGEYVMPLGSAVERRQGADVTVFSYGAMVHQALAAAEQAAADGIDTRVVDLVSLKPLDTEAILEHATATGKVVVAHAANRMAGVGAEIAALIAESAFDSLDGPIVRLGGADTPVPFSPPLEDAYRPNAGTIAAAIRRLAAY
jgi:2-oxoisovalerate dehydrogenase E1 component beta subunit